MDEILAALAVVIARQQQAIIGLDTQLVAAQARIVELEKEGDAHG